MVLPFSKKVNKIGIIQPGRLGDIIICAPIAKHYYDIGNEVHWPVFDNYYNMVRDAFPYIHFIPVSSDIYRCVYEAYYVLRQRNISDIFDIAATFPGSTSTAEYNILGDGLRNEKFDEFKYRKCNVDIQKKFQLEYIRNFDNEQKLLETIAPPEEFCLICDIWSGGKINIKIDVPLPLVYFQNIYSLFDWRIIAEKSKGMILSNSAFANFINQIQLPQPKVFLNPSGRILPVLTKDWRIQTCNVV